MSERGNEHVLPEEEFPGAQAHEATALLPDTTGQDVTPMAIELRRIEIIGNKRKSSLAMCVSHVLSTWGQRGWEFMVGILMVQIYPSSLLLVAMFGMFDAAAVTLFSSSVGGYIDRTPRYKAACIMYSIQNIGVILSALGCIFLLSFDTSGRGALFWIAVAGTICTACTSSVGATGATISVEREWTKQLYTGDHQGLARMNAGMKRIDLICLILSPVALGLIMSTAGSTVAILSMGFWNILFWPLECILLDKARNESPILRTMANHMAKPQDTAQENEADSSAGLLDLASGFGLYFKQDVFPAAFSLALIYLTVMSFGTIMTGYLAWSGVAEIELSLFRGLGALSGVLATFVFPYMYRRIGLVKTSLVSIYLQLASLVLATFPSFLKFLWTGSASDKLSTITLMLGISLSRFGLWSFDISVNQVLQMCIPENIFAKVFGVQQSFQSLFQMAAYVITLLFPNPRYFVWLMLGSDAVVLLASLLFSSWCVWWVGPEEVGTPASVVSP